MFIEVLLQFHVVAHAEHGYHRETTEDPSSNDAIFTPSSILEFLVLVHITAIV